MTQQNNWEKLYQNAPLSKINWHRAKYDYLKQLINSGKIKSGTALDLGCGPGNQSVFLAQKGFKVTGIDISPTAIKYAKENAKNANLEIDFIVADATDLSILKNKKFDLILDWANLHGIPENLRDKYIKEISKHTKKGSKLILRCFGRKKQKDKAFKLSPIAKIHIFTEQEINQFYNQYFKILESNFSPAPGSKTAPSKFFCEFLMERI